MASKLLTETLSAIKNAAVANKNELVRRPVSKLLSTVLGIMKKEGYLKDYEVLKDDRGGEVRIFLNGTINNVGVISPHFPVGVDGFEKFEKRFLPAKGFGRLILTTPKGVMTQVEAKKIKQGGVLLAFVY